MKKYWHIWVGVGVILVAVLIILAVIFLPRLAAKSDMEALFEIAMASDAQYVMLVDPTYKHPGILAGEGREIRLEGDARTNAQTVLAAMAQDFSYEKKESAGFGAFGTHLLVKGADGRIAKIYLAQELFYAELEGSVYYFRPGDAQGYATFYHSMMSYLQMQITIS